MDNARSADRFRGEFERGRVPARHPGARSTSLLPPGGRLARTRLVRPADSHENHRCRDGTELHDKCGGAKLKAQAFAQSRAIAASCRADGTGVATVLNNIDPSVIRHGDLVDSGCAECRQPNHAAEPFLRSWLPFGRQGKGCFAPWLEFLKARVGTAASDSPATTLVFSVAANKARSRASDHANFSQPSSAALAEESSGIAMAQTNPMRRMVNPLRSSRCSP